MQHPDALVRRATDGDLMPAERLVLRDHLASCGRCNQQLASLELLDARLRALPQLAPARDFAAAVRAQLASQPAPRRLPPWRLPLALALLGLLGIGLTYGEFTALLGSLAASVYDLSLWLLALAEGSGDLGRVSWPSSGLDPLLLFGLCLVGGASALVLQRTLAETALDA